MTSQWLRPKIVWGIRWYRSALPLAFTSKYPISTSFDRYRSMGTTKSYAALILPG